MGLKREKFCPDWILIAIVVTSLVLRIVLAEHGGQRFFADESRYFVAADNVPDLTRGEIEKVLEETFSHADHLGFRVIMLLPALYQQAWGWTNNTVAILGSGIFSVGCILLVYGVARRLGAAREEARWTALFMATANSLFYWSSHLMPYDMALCFALACLYVGVHPSPGWHRSILAGFLGFCAFVTYNGYWLIVGLALVLHVLLAWPSALRASLRAVFAAIGLAAPFLGLLYWASARDYPLTESYFQFSQSIVQGDFSQGHRIITDYLWAAEGAMCFVWLAAAGWFIVTLIRREAVGANRAWIGLGGVVVICASLVALSNFAGKFVVYGRLVREVVPFFVLLSGWAAADFCRRHVARIGLRPGLALAIILVAAGNFYVPLTQRWDFEERALKYRDAYRERSGPTEAERIPLERFKLVEQPGFIWPMPVDFDLPEHVVLLRDRHPMQFRAFLYEGYNQKQRAAVLATDISNRLVLLKQ